MKLIHNDNKFLRGDVRIIINDSGKRPKLWHEDHNVVVDNGRARVAMLLSGESSDFVDFMIIGNGGASPPNNISPTAPSRSNTALLGRIGATPLQSGQTTTDSDATQAVSAIRSTNTIRFDATFSGDDIDHTSYPLYGTLGLDAIYVNELGLIVSGASDELFSRITFAPIQFQNGTSRSITVQWTISIL
jgi:hypothetical protein